MTITEHTIAGFLADIVVNPESDDVRLIFADFLDEQGEGERAEFIRVQIELANGKPCRAEIDHGKSGWHVPGATGKPHQYGCERCRLRAIERDLTHSDAMRAEADKFAALFGLTGNFATDHGFEGGMGGRNWKWTRGFISEIVCQEADLLRPGLAASLWRAAPITSCALSCRNPDQYNDGFCWFKVTYETPIFGDESEDFILSPMLFDLLEGGTNESRLSSGWSGKRYKTKQEAVFALDHAAVLFGRTAAGLPRLEARK